MRTFRSALFDMLSGALVAQAHVSKFVLEEPAVKFFVDRALRNIDAKNLADASKLRAAIKAVQDVPLFIARIERQTSNKSYITEASASDLTRTLTRDCIYPWCTDQP